jgi:oxysterol-binding protein-related protein 3/6/7
MHEFATDSSSLSNSVLLDDTPQSVQRVMAALDKLKVQHAALLKSLPAHPIPDSSRFMQASLPITTEEEEQPNQLEHHGSPRLTSPTSKRSRRSSVSTTVSDSVHEWFDALDVAEEFVMNVQITPEGGELSSQLFTNDTRSAVSHQEDSSVDTDIEENDKPPLLAGERPGVITRPFNKTSAVVRRTKLPASPAGDEGSLFAILKKNIGKVCMFSKVVISHLTSIRTWLQLHSQLLSTSL